MNQPDREISELRKSLKEARAALDEIRSQSVFIACSGGCGLEMMRLPPDLPWLCKTCEESLATLRRERDEMREALEPFGEYGAGFSSDWPDACPLTADPDAVVGKRPNIGDLRRAAALSGLSNSREPGEHQYVSTACQHGLHDQCRRECKFCGVKCGCPCGHMEPGEKA